MSDMPDVVYAKELTCSPGGWWVRKPDPGTSEYISAEKAKADKLALLEEIKQLPIWTDRIYLRRRDVIDVIQKRIEAE